MTATAAAVAGLYDTPAKIHTYAAAVTSGNALQAINGRVEGIDSLGGIVQDEFGFLASILLPLLGISLVARATRREEESGRVELVLAGRVARHQPILAALITATGAILATAALFAVGLTLTGIPATGSVLYAASLAGAGLRLRRAHGAVGAGGPARAQRLRRGAARPRRVLRAAGGRRRHQQLGDLAVPARLGREGRAVRPAALVDARGPARRGRGARHRSPCSSAGGRDLGSALVHGRTGPARATLGAAHPDRVRRPRCTCRPSPAGWPRGCCSRAMMGALAQQLIDAMTGNPALADAIGVSRDAPLDGFVAMSQLYLAVIATGYAVQAVGALRAEEAAGRLEHRLSGTLSRARWLAAHASWSSPGSSSSSWRRR